MSDTSPVYISKETPEIQQHLEKIYPLFNQYDLDKPMLRLVYLLASQINACAFCVNMHTSDARNAGESNVRLDNLVVWRHVDFFSAKEKSIFAWTEALTRLDEHTDKGLLRAALKEHFSNKEIAVLTTNIAMINLWNRIGISTH